MAFLDYLLLGAIALALVWALGVCVRNRKKGKTCSGDCASCGRDCSRF